MTKITWRLTSNRLATPLPLRQLLNNHLLDRLNRSANPQSLGSDKRGENMWKHVKNIVWSELFGQIREVFFTKSEFEPSQHTKIQTATHSLSCEEQIRVLGFKDIHVKHVSTEMVEPCRTHQHHIFGTILLVSCITLLKKSIVLSLLQGLTAKNGLSPKICCHKERQCLISEPGPNLAAIPVSFRDISIESDDVNTMTMMCIEPTRWRTTHF